MNNNTRKLTLGAAMAALALVFIYISAVSPTMDLALNAMAGVAVTVVVVEAGPVYGLLCFITAGALGAIFFQGGALPFLALFGWYPCIKYLIEKIDRIYIEWIIKIAVFTASFTFMYFIQAGLLTNMAAKFNGLYVIVYIVALLGFIVFDYGLSKLIQLYVRRIMPKIRKK